MSPEIDGIEERIKWATAYLDSRTSSFYDRSIRYNRVAETMLMRGIATSDLVCDVGAGAGDFGYYLQGQLKRHIRYWPVDAYYDGTDLETWTPPRRAEWFTLIEIAEHLRDPFRLLAACEEKADIGVVLTTPNPEEVDILAIDDDHKVAIQPAALERRGYRVRRVQCFGTPRDTLLAYKWGKDA